MANFLEFEVCGVPVPKARPRFLRDGRCYTPDRTRVYEAKVRTVAVAEKLRSGHKAPWDGAIALHVVFYNSRKRTGRPDLDNLVKSIKDALTGVCYVDDGQVVFLQAWKEVVRKGQERVEIILHRLGDDDAE